MPRLMLFTLCQSVSIDYALNTLSIFNMLEQTNAPNFPAELGEVACVTIWMRNDDEVGASMLQNVVVLDPDGVRLGGIETSFVLERLRHRIVNRLQRVALPRPGMYEFQLFVRREDGEYSPTPVWTYPFELRQAPAESP